MENPSHPGYLILHNVAYVTTSEAAEALGPDVTKDMIKDWAKRGILEVAGRYPGRSTVYRLSDVAEAERRTRMERRGRTRRAGELQKITDEMHNLPSEAQVDSAQPVAKRPRCSVTRDNGLSCNQWSVPDAPFRICRDHMRQAYLHWRDHLVEIYQNDPNARHDPELETNARRGGGDIFPTDSFVYYVRFSGRIKIGFSEQVRARISALPVDEVLALEPGGRELEQMRHKQFRQYRANKEWFEPGPDLLDHIAMLTKHYGTPHAQLAALQPEIEEGPDGIRRPKPLRSAA